MHQTHVIKSFESHTILLTQRTNIECQQNCSFGIKLAQGIGGNFKLQMEEDNLYKGLQQTYSQAISKLNEKQNNQGIQLLQQVLSSPIINHEQIRYLKYSALVSLGEALIGVSMSQALNCFEGGLLLLQQNPRSSVITSSKTEEQFSLIIKMVELTQKLNIPERQIELLKKAIEKSPKKWRSNLFYKLKDLLIQTNKQDELHELSALEAEFLNLQPSPQKKEEEGSYLPNIKITFNLTSSKQDHNVWQKIFTVAYILLKFSQNRTLQTKKSFSQWTSSQEWQLLKSSFDVFRTQIVLVFTQDAEKNLMQKLIDQEDNSVKIGNMLIAAAEEMLSIKYQNQLSEYRKYENYQNYPNLDKYLIELMKFRGFDIELLKYLSLFDQQYFKDLFEKIVTTKLPMNSMEAEEKGQQEGEEEEQERQGQAEEDQFKIFGIQASPFAFDNHDPVKLSKNMNEVLKQMLRIQISAFSSQDSISFSSTILMVERLTGLLTTQAASVKTKQAILSNFNIRLMLSKVITLIIKRKENTFQQITESNVYDQNGESSKFAPLHLKRKGIFLELLNIRIQQLAIKIPKNTEFALHQTQKINLLLSFIKQRILNADPLPQKPKSLSKIQLNCQIYYSTQILRFYCLTNESKAINEIQTALVNLQICYKEIIKVECRKQQRPLESVENLVKIFRKKVIDVNLRRDELKRSEESFKQVITRSPEYLTPFPKNLQKKEEEIGIDNEYVQNAIKYFSRFFKKLQNPTKQIFICEISPWAQVWGLKDSISNIYNKLTLKDIKFQKIHLQLYSKLLMTIIKIYLLDPYPGSDIALRVIFFVTKIVINLNKDNNNLIVPKSLVLNHALMKYKQFSPKTLSTIRRKIYANLVNHNKCEEIYHPSIFGSDQLSPQSRQLKTSVLQILNEIYMWPQFDPKKPERAINFFVFVYHLKNSQFQTDNTIFQPDLARVVKICYQIYQEKRQEVFAYCPDFIKTMEIFGTVMHGSATKVDREVLIGILKGQEQICECCLNLKKKMPMYCQALLVVAHYHLQKPYLIDEDQPNFIYKFSMLDEFYFLELILIDPREPSHWQNLLKANYFKVAKYYDSLAHKILDQLKPKIQFLKRMIAIIMLIFPEEEQLILTCRYYRELLSLMKMRERQYRMVMKDLEGAGMNTCKESKQSIKRYKQGLKRTLSESANDPVSDVRIRALRVIELKLKLAWISIQKQYKQDDKKEMVIIQLEQYQSVQDKVFKPSKLKEQILIIISDIRSIIFDIRHDRHNQTVKYLEQDLIVEMYAFLFNTMYWKLQKIVNRLCEVIRVSSKTDQCRKLKEMQQKFNELEYIATIFLRGDFLSNNVKYRIREEKEEERKKQQKIKRDQYQMMFTNIFFPKMEPERPKHVEPMNLILDAKYGRPKGKKDTIQIQEENVQQYTEINDNESNYDNRSVWGLNPSRRAKQAFNPSNHINVGRYFYNRLKQYMIDNQAAASRFNAIESVIGSYSFYNLLYSMTKIMQELLRIFLNISQGKQARTHNKRALAISLWTCSQIVLFYSGNWRKAQQLVQQAYDLQSDDIVYTHISPHSPQHTIFPVTQHYHRSMVRQMTKRTYIEHLFRIFQKGGEIVKIIDLLNKLLKLSKGYAHRRAPLDLSVGSRLAFTDDKIVESGAVTENIKFYFFMFEIGATYLVDALKRQSTRGELQTQYEKYLVFVEEEIQGRVEREDTNFYLNRVKVFRNDYEVEYNKLLKPRKKKDKDDKLKRQNKKRRKSYKSDEIKQEQGPKKNIWEIQKTKARKKKKKSTKKGGKTIKKPSLRLRPKPTPQFDDEQSESETETESDLKVEE